MHQWLALIPFSLFQVVLVMSATALSLYFLLRNLYPIISSSANTSAKLLVLVVAGLHLVLGLALWWGFLAGGNGNLGKDVEPGGISKVGFRTFRLHLGLCWRSTRVRSRS